MSEIATAQARTPSIEHTLSWNTALRWTALVVAGGWTGYFLFTGMPQLTLEVFPRTLVLHILAGALALVYVVYLAAARRLPGGSPLDLPVLGFVAAYALATATSVSWRVSLDATLYIGVALIVFYALSDLPFLDARQLVRAFQLVGVAISLYALWVVGNDYADYLRYTREIEELNSSNIFPPTVPRVHDVSDHPNVLAMLLTLFMPFFALSAYRAPTRWERAGGFAALLVAGIAIFLTLSRGGWIGAGAGVALTLAGAWVTTRAFERERAGFGFSWESIVPREMSVTALATIVGALVLVAGGTLAFLANSSTRPGWLFRSSLSPREDAWRVGRDILQDNPLLGAGPNTFGLLYPQYSGKFLVHTQHAHNGFLQVADDAGIVGLAALAALGVVVAYMLWRTWRHGTLEQRLIAVACAGALAGFSLHNQLDAGNIWKAPAIALALMGAILVRNFRERPPADRPTADRPWLRYASIAARAVLLLMLFMPFIAWYRTDTAHRDYWRGMEALADDEQDDLRTRYAEGIPHLQDAVNGDSSMMVYQLQLGQAQATYFDLTGRSAGGLIEAAIVHLQRAVALDERSDLAHANLARAYQLAGRDDEAAAEAAKARFIASHHVPPVLVAGEVYEDLGREDDAVATYGQAVSMDAGLADSEFWEGTAFRRGHFGEILERSALGVNPCTLGAYLVQAHRSDPSAPLEELDEASEACRLLVFGFPEDLVLRTAYAKILMEQGRSDDAFEHLDYAVGRQPDFGPSRTELGRWHNGQGDIDEARHQWAIGGQLDEAESLLLLGESYPAGEVPHEVRSRLAELVQVSGSSVQQDLISILYYRMRYGRLSPLTALIPGAWLTAVPRLQTEMQRAVQRWEAEAE